MMGGGAFVLTASRKPWTAYRQRLRHHAHRTRSPELVQVGIQGVGVCRLLAPMPTTAAAGRAATR